MLSTVTRSNLSRSLARLQFQPKPARQISTLLPRRPILLAKSQASISPPVLLSIREVASSVSNRPGSQSIPHAVQNIKEEAGHAIEDVAQAIAGGKQPLPFGSTPEGTPLNGGFVGITSAVAAAVPTPIMVFGLAGALPYLGTSAFTVYLANQAGQAASGVVTKVDPNVALSLLDQALQVQVTYGAMSGYGGTKGAKRLMLGIAPTLVGWSTLGLDPGMALATQWAAFTGLWYADMKATAAGWTPMWYSQYRFYLSVLVGTCIIGTLAGTSYLGPSQSHSMALRELQQLRHDREAKLKEERDTPVAPGEVGSVSGEEEGADAYVLIRHAPEKKEEEEKKKKKDDAKEKEQE
ncbi:hypothetical protein FRC17_010791 [Serendipita sp. 399]|nr:hypothetical protein FRC17_010791 [Serendipita sp. 399]